MWKLTDINDQTENGNSCIKQVQNYIETKNLNFIVAQGKLKNIRHDKLNAGEATDILKGYAACDFAKISFFNKKPSPPFIAANFKQDIKTARVEYLIDFNEEAKNGEASKFYSKILGAFATHLFSECPEIDRLWFPFIIEDIVGSKMGVELDAKGTSIIRS